jgi:hypothetical protein
MKVRNGFVSNSSSTSFVISKKQLNKVQISMIINHKDVCKTLGYEWSDVIDEFNVIEKAEFIFGETMFRQIGMVEYLEEIVEIGKDYVHWISDWTPNISAHEILEKDVKTNMKKRKEKLRKIDKNL